MDAAATAYVALTAGGTDTLLMTADHALRRELSRRIRDDLIALGTVSDGPAVTIADGTQASRGDLIIATRNDHRVEAGEPGRTLANGDLLRIDAVTPGGLIVRCALDADPQTGQRQWTARTFLYANYRDAELGYAVTDHVAQGRTVHTGLAVFTGTQDRQHALVALTRGTMLNLAYVFTLSPKRADPVPGPRPAPELTRYDLLHSERTGDPGPAAPPVPPGTPLGVLAAGHDLPWAVTALGPVPAHPADRLDWQQRASSIGAYRELSGYDHSSDPIEPEPATAAPETRAAWQEAAAALGDGPDVRGMPDGRLLHLRDTYPIETAWAPRYVGDELRQVRAAAWNARLAGLRASVEAAAARQRGDHGTATSKHELAASYQALQDAYRQRETVFAAVMADREDWDAATRDQRHLSVAADTELRRRYPEQPFPRSAPPNPNRPPKPRDARQVHYPVTTGVTSGPSFGRKVWSITSARS